MTHLEFARSCQKECASLRKDIKLYFKNTLTIINILNCKKNLVTKNALVNNFYQPWKMGAFCLLLSLSLPPFCFLPHGLHAEPRTYPGLRDQLSQIIYWRLAPTKTIRVGCIHECLLL